MRYGKYVVALAVFGVCMAAFAFYQLRGQGAAWQESYDAALADVAAKNCKKTEYPEFIFFDCEKDFASYFFTKPNTPAHPGVIKRSIENKNGEAHMLTEAHSWGDDAVQPAFVAWMNRVAASLGPR